MSRDSRHPADPVHLQDSIVVDVTLVDGMLALTPAERLRANDRMIRTVEELKRGATDAKGQLSLAVLEAILQRTAGG